MSAKRASTTKNTRPDGGGQDRSRKPQRSLLSREAQSGILPPSQISDSLYKAPEQKIQTVQTTTKKAAPKEWSCESCIICLEGINHSDPIWECSLCYCLFHLICIQTWIEKRLVKPTNLSSELFPDAPEAPWHCPKCRKEYTPAERPTTSYCFCKKVKNPPVDPWIAPHSCGLICNRHLSSSGCEHLCTQLCHPGRCPPCPQTVQAFCFCGKEKTLRRCIQRKWSCQQVCGKLLSCKQHYCTAICHEGDCPDCPETSLQRCRCGRKEMNRPCASQGFQCEKVCGKPLGCGHHGCELICHSGPCPTCPLLAPRKCPCQKKTYTLPCDVPTPSSCGDTCEKLLSCGIHHCSERCHKGPCPPCRETVTKSCRCRQSRKMVACSSEYLCEKRCMKIRDCTRHPCKRKCCPGSCPPCEEICGRKLGCGNHKCETRCHAGPCFSCPLTVDISCFCQDTVVTVPCGAERRTPIPKCGELCRILPFCHHPKREDHTCHFGECPKCEKICDKQYSDCEHHCRLKCHDPEPEWPALTKKEKKLKEAKQLYLSTTPFPTPLRVDQVQCPPCPLIVERSCLGEHEVREVVCSSEREFSCHRECGNPLECTNHRCTLPCHLITYRRAIIKKSKKSAPILTTVVTSEKNQTVKREEQGEEGEGEGEGEGEEEGEEVEAEEEVEEVEDTCMKCELPCEKPRVPFCKHPCSSLCHPGECEPCSEILKKKCFCLLRMDKVVRCFELTSCEKEEKKLEQLLSCGNVCSKQLENCCHTCKRLCHSGPCQNPNEKCHLRISVRCKCGNLRQEWECFEALETRQQKSISDYNFVTLLDCNQECQAKREERVRIAEQEAQKKKLAQMSSSSQENEIKKRKSQKKPTNKDENKNVKEKDKNAKFKRNVLIAVLIFILLVILITWSYLSPSTTLKRK